MIKLDTEYYIAADMLQVTLKRKFKSSGKPVKGEKREMTEDTVGYFTTISSAIMAYRRIMTRQWIANEDLTLGEYYDKLAKLDAHILRTLDKHDGPILDKAEDVDGKRVKEVAEAKSEAKEKSEAKKKIGGDQK